MKRVAAFLFVVALFGTSGAAFAQLPPVPPLPVPIPPAPIPPVPIPPVPIPPVPIPPVPVLPPPAPPPPAPQPAPPPPALPNLGGVVGSVTQTVTGTVAGATGAVGSVSGGLGSGGSGSGGSGSGGSGSGGSGGSGAGGPGAAASSGAGAAAAASGSGAAGPAGAGRVSVTGLRVVRNTGAPRNRTAVVVKFALARPALIRVRIQRVAPDCTPVGRFALRGRPGENSYRFTGRFRGAALPAGTYHLSANAVRRGRFFSLGRAVVVIAPAGGATKSSRPQRSTCGSTDEKTSAGGSVMGSTGGGSGADVQARADENVTAGANGAGDGSTAAKSADRAEGAARDGRILGVVPNPFEGLPTWLQPLLLVTLGLAILLLLAAALPATAVRPVGAAPIVLKRRSELALVGTMVLGAVAVLALAF